MNEIDVKQELYISIDVEADGPVPGAFSMTAFGAAVAGFRVADTVVPIADPTNQEHLFYAELAPISPDWDVNAFRVGLLEGWVEDPEDEGLVRKRAHLESVGQDPVEVMTSFVVWVEDQKVKHNAARAVIIGYPVVYDWMWMYWYLMKFAGSSPFGHSGALDMKTAYAVKAGVGIGRAVKGRMPRKLMSKLPHTHKASDDAAEQGVMGMNILRWDGQR